MIPRVGGHSGASLSIPHARRAVAGALFVASLGGASEPVRLSQAGDTLTDDEASALVRWAGVFGFFLPPPAIPASMILTLPGWTAGLCWCDCDSRLAVTGPGLRSGRLEDSRQRLIGLRDCALGAGQDGDLRACC
jgi:hypothetical protein